jgi:hypothetical protein
VKVIYCCYGSSHSSVVAAAIHLGNLPTDTIPHPRDILNLPYYDRVTMDEVGACIHMGRDDIGCDVYILGMGPGRRIVKRAVESIFQVCGVSRDSYMLVDTLTSIGVITKIGGFLSRRIGLTRIGRPMATWGIRRAYPRLVSIVARVKSDPRYLSFRSFSEALGYR